MERQHITIDPRAITLDLSPRDLDRMVGAQRIKDDTCAGLSAMNAAILRAEDPALPPGTVRLRGERNDTLFAYAPDPDADYAQGVSDGYLLGLNAAPPIQWMPRTVSAGDQLIKLALFVAFIAVVTWAVLQ